VTARWPQAPRRRRGSTNSGCNEAEPGRPSPRTQDEEEQRLRDQRVEAEERGIGFLSIRRRAEGDVVGFCGLLVGRCSIDEPEIA